MADRTLLNGEFSDDQTVEVTGGEDPSEISGFAKNITDLERENGNTIRENEGYKQQIEELGASIEQVGIDNEELKKKLESAESENKIMGTVAARAAELEAEVSRLQHDLVSAMSDLLESNVELSDLKRDLEGVKGREKEKDVKLEAIVRERDLLLAEVEKLEGAESSLRDELEGKEKEIRSLKKDIEELQGRVQNSNSLEKLKNELEKAIEKMEGDISILESRLEEKEEKISSFIINEAKALDALTEGKIKGLVGNVKQKDWIVVGGLTIAAVAVMGFTCYIQAARKH